MDSWTLRLERAAEVARDPFDPLRRRLDPGRDAFGPIVSSARGGLRFGLVTLEAGFEIADPTARLYKFIGNADGRHDQEAPVSDLAEALPHALDL
jgi:hypothetical protein